LGGAVLPGDAADEPFDHARGLLQLRVSEQPLERRVLPLEVLEPLRVVDLQSADLVAPAVIRLLRALQLAADVGDVLALAQHPIQLG
jgi:hypothetical protein